MSLSHRYRNDSPCSIWEARFLYVPIWVETAVYCVCMVCENFRVSLSVLILWHAMARPMVAKTDCCSYGYERHGTPSRAISFAKYHCVRMIRLHIWDSVSCPISFVARSVHAGSSAISLILSNLSCAVLVFLMTCPRYRLYVFGCRQHRKVLQPELSVNYTRKLTTFLLLHLEIYVTLRPQRPYGLLGAGSSGRPPRLSHSSWTLNCYVTPVFWSIFIYPSVHAG